MRKGARVAGVVVAGALLVGAGAAVSWAVATATGPVSDPLAPASFTLARVAPGEVGASIAVNTTAEWKPVEAGLNRASGVVTQVMVKPGTKVRPGSVLYTVNLRPVVVAEGSVPAFRPIAAGLKGRDVEQLQRLLRTVGVFDGKPDGVAGPATVKGIRAWQKSLGVERSGVVELGDVVFVASLPARVVLDPDVVERGRILAGTEAAISTLPASPVFSAQITEAQAGLVPLRSVVEVTSPEGGIWHAIAGEQNLDPQTGSVAVALSGVDRQPVCGAECRHLPVTGKTVLAGLVVTVPKQAGMVVPSAALVTAADGATAVISETGGSLPVRVVASARGMSVVEGLADGTQVRVPGAAR